MKKYNFFFLTVNLCCNPASDSSHRDGSNAFSSLEFWDGNALPIYKPQLKKMNQNLLHTCTFGAK